MMKKIYVLIILLAAAGYASAANPQVTLHISGAVSGDIVLELYPDKAPITVANFIDYVQTGFYDGLVFHRVKAGFMIQGGGFDTDLVQKTTNDPIINESSTGLSNLTGTIAMARTPHPHSATSQFFINVAENTSLDYAPIVYDGQNNAYSKYGYCAFGNVISGMDVVNAIAAAATTTRNEMTDVPVEDIIIAAATVSLNAPVCAEKSDGDVNGDCRVDLLDFSEIAQNWLICNSITPTCN